jgi:hypothetical protein
VCGSDGGDTLGVTGALAETAEASVVMRCDDCRAVYLSPAGDAAADGAPREVSAARRLAGRFAGGGVPAERILPVEDGAAMPASGRYERVLLLHALESAAEPARLLARAASLLDAGGRVVVVAANAGSSCFAVFGGRHWCGYAPRGTRQQLTAEALNALAGRAGLRIARMATAWQAAAWLQSTERWLRDWGAGKWLIGLATGKWLLPQACAALLETIAVLRGRGALLLGEMVRA